MGIEYIDKTHARLVVSIGSGKHRTRRVKRITYTGKKDAQRQYREFENSVSLEQGIDTELTVEKMLDMYIERFLLNGGKENTARAYRVAAKPAVAYFEGVNAAEVTLYMVERFISKETDTHSPKTIKNEMSLLRSAFKQAIKSGMLRDNPCQYATIPRQKKPKIEILNDTDMGTFVAALDKMPLDFKVMCELALFCGLRRSEIMGLTKTDVTDTVTISKVRHRIKGEDIIETPKTATSNRTLAVPPFVTEDVQRLVQLQQERPYESDYLICNSFGEPVSPSWCDKRMRWLVQHNDLPHVTMHGLRHTYASMLIKEGVPISEVSAQLGHASVDITLRIYTHLYTEASTASKAISNLIQDKMAPKWHQQ